MYLQWQDLFSREFPVCLYKNDVYSLVHKDVYGAKINSSLDWCDITCTTKTKPILKGPQKEPKTSENPKVFDEN